eukprot:754350-Hanusia_phi.AAC.2
MMRLDSLLLLLLLGPLLRASHSPPGDRATCLDKGLQLWLRGGEEKDYEAERELKLRKNAELLRQLGLSSTLVASADPSRKQKRRRRRRTQTAGAEDETNVRRSTRKRVSVTYAESSQASEDSGSASVSDDSEEDEEDVEDEEDEEQWQDLEPRPRGRPSGEYGSYTLKHGPTPAGRNRSALCFECPEWAPKGEVKELYEQLKERRTMISKATGIRTFKVARRRERGSAGGRKE